MTATPTTFALAQVIDAGTMAAQSADAYLPLAGGTMTGPIAMGGSEITGAGNIEIARAQAGNGTVLLTVRSLTHTTRRIAIGTVANAGNTDSWPAIWLNQASPALNNYAFLGGSTGETIFNTPAGQSMFFRVNNATLMTMSTAGWLHVGGTAAPTAPFDATGNTIRIRSARTPASAGATGNAGDVCWDADYIYVCIAANTWRRVAHASW